MSDYERGSEKCKQQIRKKKPKKKLRQETEFFVWKEKW